MPEISLFYGTRVTMYYDDHNSPHFHAELGIIKGWKTDEPNQSVSLKVR